MKKIIKLDYFKTTEEFVTNIILVNFIDFEVKIQKINKGEKIKNWIKK